jgi:hypothetical protein
MPQYQIIDESGRTLLVEGDTEPDPSDVDFLLSQLDQPQAPAAPDLEQPPGQVSGIITSATQGFKTTQQAMDARRLADTSGGPTMRQERRAFVQAMEDPRYMDLLSRRPNDLEAFTEQEVGPGSMASLVGPESKLQDMRQGVEMDRREIVERMAAREKDIQAQSLAPGYQQYREAKGVDAVKAFLANPVEVTLNIVAQGLGSSVQALLGAAAGGVVAGPVGTAVGAGTGSFSIEHAHAILESLAEEGVDLKDPDALLAAFKDTNKLARARERGVKRGIPIAMFDAFSGGVAGKFLMGSKGFKEIVKKAGLETAVQTGSGAAGEAVAQLVSEGNVNAWRDVFEEAIGELGPGAVEAAVNVLSARQQSVPSTETQTEGSQDASQDRTTEEIHGDVRQEPEQVQEAVPAQETGSGVQPQEEEVLESRIVSEEEAPELEYISQEDVEAYFDRRFGKTEEQPESPDALEARRPGRFTFPDYDQFKKWMGERYAERDLDGMKLAFAEASNKDKAKFAKELLRGADDHLRNWIYHMAAGADLTDIDPPVKRTTPRPMPDGSTQPVETPAQQPPGPPPKPPPQNVPQHRPFNITAMVQLLRRHAKFPTVNERLVTAYGRYMTKAQQIELKGRLMWDQKLASRMLGHEIGHWIDLAIEATGRGKDFAQRLKPMFDFKKDIAGAAHLKNQAKALSAEWRGPFSPNDRYRNRSQELLADFLSAMFNDPDWVNQNYPELFDAFQDLRDAKPAFKSAYREVETWLQGETMAQELIDQDKDAVVRTHDIIMEDRTAETSSIKNRLLGALMTVWNRAFEVEGRPREIGKSLTEQLEFSYTWAANQMSVWFDDYLRNVQPLIDKVSADPVQAQAALLSYTKARRVIGERRAAGVWIEENPEDARSLLRLIVAVDPALNDKYIDAVESAEPDQIYDLSAVILREIHDQGEALVNRVTREIDNADLGVSGQSFMVAFNVRGKLLNPQGLTPETAQSVLNQLREELGPERFQALEQAASNLRDLLFGVQRRMYESGLIPTKMWEELIAPNRDNYVPFAVLDYFEGSVGAGVMPQKGTAKDVADVSAATQLKVVSSFGWLQRQRQAQLIRQIWQRAGNPMELGQRLKRSSQIKDIRRAHKHDNTSRIVIWDNGQPHVLEIPGDRGKTMETATSMPDFYEHIRWFQGAAQFTHRIMAVYTQLTPSFLFWRNPIRGARTAYLKLGVASLAKQIGPKRTMELMKLAYNYAEAATGKPMLPLVRELVESQALPAPHLAYGEVRDLSSARELMARGALPVFVAHRIRESVPEKAGPVRTGARKFKALTDKSFTAYEAFEKIYNFQAALEAGHDVQTARGVARRAGIVNPGVAGKWSFLMEIFYPWTRIRLQGLRVTYQMLRDPRFRDGYMARFGMSEALPRMLKVAIASGIIGGLVKWLLPGDDDENDTVMAEVMRRISPYKMALDDLVPLMFFDPRTGSYIPFWTFKKGSEIPDHFEVISFRIPASEEGITWGTFLYHALASAPGLHDQIGQPDKGWMHTMGSWAGDYLAPGLNPAITTLENTMVMIGTGENPEDPYTMHPSANEQMFDAGGMERAQAIAGYVMNELGGPGVLAGIMAANFGLMDERALNAFSKRLESDKKSWIESIPFSSTAFSFDNYAKYRTERLSQVEEDKLRAGARLLMPPRLKSMYDFYYRNSRRKDKLSDNELAQLEVASAWVRDVWGTLTIQGDPNPDSWYSKAGAAMNGSRQAKTTFKRDIEAVSAEFVEEFEAIRSAP